MATFKNNDQFVLKNSTMKKAPAFLITIDVEDWFQVENFKPYIPYDSWVEKEYRVEKNIHRILDLLDSIIFDTHLPNGSDYYQRPRATFFVLGWVAKKSQRLVREIINRGHEVASHGMNHHLCSDISLMDLKQDLILSRKLLEDITGVKIKGYRAPSFSVSNDILKLIESCGYLYDSSYNSFSRHGRYGIIDPERFKKMGVAYLVDNNFYELPISNLRFADRILPWGGGAYFRIMPLMLFLMGVKRIMKYSGAYIFYLHPWELDPSQPRVSAASNFVKFRHYTNLKHTESKLQHIMKKAIPCRFISCGDYIDEISSAARANNENISM